jgi:Winged helix-turn helix
MAEPVRARRLTDQEGRLLQIVRRGKHRPVRVRRAMIIVVSASGTLVPAIARLAAAGEDTVRDVIHTFNAKGLAALDPRRAWAGRRGPGGSGCGSSFTSAAAPSSGPGPGRNPPIRTGTPGWTGSGT